MVEILNTEENNLEKENNEAIENFQAEEENLNKEIKDGEPKKMEKIGKNKVKFPYESNEHECSLILEKKGDKVFVKLEKMPTYMGDPMDNEFKKPERKQWLVGKTIDASSSEIFLKGLGKILDDIVGKGRVGAAEKAEEAYKLLGFQNA